MIRSGADRSNFTLRIGNNPLNFQKIGSHPGLAGRTLISQPMKHLFALLLLLPLFGFSQNQKNVDTVAIAIIDKMGEVLGSLEAISFDLNTVHDEANESGLLERRFNSHQIFMRGPDRFAIRSHGEKGNRGYWYNGSFMTWYSYDQNNYVTLPAQGSIISAIDSVNTTFGIQFPGVDILYPSFADDLIAEFDQIQYAGMKDVEGTNCLHIIAESESLNFQLWIENGAFYLPKKYLIFRKGDAPEVDEGTFGSWDTNVTLPDAIFEFTPPKNANLISIMPKN